MSYASFKMQLRGGAALTVLALAAMSSQTSAQQAPQSQAAQSEAVDEIVVTGTRIVRDGYEAPTPLTVLGEEQLQALAPENIADLVNDLPSMVGSATPQTSNLSFSNGQAGLNTLNLRNIGGNRTLVLLDGQRSVPSTITGLVDVNDFPQQLISRVDVVTGGASAAYGSDALSGVVNFVLNKEFTGIKGEISSGITTYGDDPFGKISLSAGVPFANDRGHLLLSGESSYRHGIWEPVPRKWNDERWVIMNNPAYGTGAGQTRTVPQRLLVGNAGLSTATPGGIIVNTALRGTYFGPGGVPATFNYGSLVNDPFMVGGDAESTWMTEFSTLDQRITRNGVFARASYDLADYVTVYAQWQWGHARSKGLALKQFNIGNLIIRADNAFIPASVAARAQALNISQFTLGTNNIDTPTIVFDNKRRVDRYVIGANGTFEAGGTDWSWDAYFQKGISRTSENGHHVTSKVEFGAAVDAVRHPTNGTIVCRVNVDANPSNDLPGCVPYNVFGIGVNTPAAIEYIMARPGHPQRNQHFTQDVLAATMNGEPFDMWAGPVSIAVGAEHRKEKVAGRADSNSLINGWFAGNYLPTFGEYSVSEAFLETVIPLAKDVGFADSLDLNGAVRATDYSTSGYVTTWKVGLTWQPMSDIRFRLTRSRDIRAPNLNDLYQAGTANTSNVTDPFNNNVVTTYQGLAVGNPALQPEKADTTGVGFVVAPSFLEGFTASVDYYDIKIKGGIQNLGAQSIVDFCFQGQTQYCPAIIRGQNATGANVILQIRNQPFNFAQQQSRGLDIEASYRRNLSDFSDGLDGDLTLRFLMTRYLENYSNDGINPAFDTVGNNSGNGPPRYIYTPSITYSLDPITMSLSGKAISKGYYASGSYRYIMCDTGCPISTTSAPTINENRIKGAFYLDGSVSYKFMETDDGTEATAYLSVSNLLNKDPPIVASGPGGFPYADSAVNRGLYDTLGRFFRAGIRFQM
ncbi:MAG: TonB-dependent receptor plug domain-containing protein [Rhodospirillaceae bacterium]